MFQAKYDISLFFYFLIFSKMHANHDDDNEIKMINEKLSTNYDNNDDDPDDLEDGEIADEDDDDDNNGNDDKNITNKQDNMKILLSSSTTTKDSKSNNSPSISFNIDNNNKQVSAIVSLSSNNKFADVSKKKLAKSKIVSLDNIGIEIYLIN